MKLNTRIKLICFGMATVITIISACFVGFYSIGTIRKNTEESARAITNQTVLVFDNAIADMNPITATIAILDVLWVWNDFLLPMLMITDSKSYTLILSANSFFGKYTAEWGNTLAGLLLTSLPLIIFYMFFQRYIIKGITSGAVKG